MTPDPSTVKAPSSITFDLSSLGWKSFQDLCGTILREILGQTVTVFPANKDGGRDAAFSGAWTRSGSEALQGEFVVQCKFAARKSNLGPRDIDPELLKIRRLVRRGLCDIYVLMTNSTISAEVAAAIREKVKAAGARWFLAVDGTQIDAYLRETPRLRALVPRVYGLGDLAEILDERAYEQTRALLAAMQEDLGRFVVTKPYGEAIEALSRHGFVLLLGAPGVGKTMIASALSVAALDAWGCPTIKADSPAAFSDHWNPHATSQFFWIDDAFGTTQCQDRIVDQWNRVLPRVAAALKRGTRFVLTSRDYIWHEARSDLKLRELTELEDRQVVVDVHDLTAADRQQILYNHLKTGGQPVEFRRAVKPYLEEICGVDDFLPEVVRQFSNPRYTHKMYISRPSVIAFFTNPVQHHLDVIRELPPDDRAAVALIFMSHGFLESPLALNAEQTEALHLLGSSPAGVLQGLHSLRGSLVTTVEIDSNGTRSSRWILKHPSISDAYSRLVAGDRELLLIYLAGAPLTGLIREITCGEVGLRGALVVPDRYFGIIVERLDSNSKDVSLHDLDSFLSSRCDADFLGLYIDRHPVLVEELTRGSRIRLAVRLHVAGLLPEPSRANLVSRLADRLVEDWDGAILDAHEAGPLLTTEEAVALRVRVAEELVPMLETHVEWLRDNFSVKDDDAPEQYLTPARNVLGNLRDLFVEDPVDIQAIDSAAAALDRVQRMLEEDYPFEPDFDDDWRRRSPEMQAVSASSIFSDVDE